MIPTLLPSMVRHGRINADPALSTQLLAVSPATIDRLLASTRQAVLKGRRRSAGKSSAIRRSVPIRTFGDWNDPAVGYFEADFVAHCGSKLSGAFIQTLVFTDVASGWTECIPVLTRDSAMVIDAITTVRGLLPFPLLGLDFDNDSVFMNEQVVGWCLGKGIEVTRARAYRKNDQAWVEQKNGAVVRRLVGYGRFEGLDSLAALNQLYSASRLHTNLFQPSFKLKSKTRSGSKVSKTYHAPQPPAHRILLREDVSKRAKTKLQQLLSCADPVLLFEEIRAAQEVLGTRVDQRGGLAKMLTPVETRPMTKPAGEQRAILRRPYRRTKPAPAKTAMLDAYADQVKVWLLERPSMTAAELLHRLQAIAPEAGFTEKQLRTLQRALHRWRAEAVRTLISRIHGEQVGSAPAHELTGSGTR